MERSDILVVIAHPDDEIFASGTICLCTERGMKVAIVCITDGEAGSRELLHTQSPLSLGEIRRRELELSAAVLGVSEVRFLGQPDAADPEAPGPGHWDELELVQRLGRLIRESDPALILTHGARGGYGHAAHRATHRCVLAAVEQTAYAGSVFSFAGQVPGAFFSWHFDAPSTVRIDARNFAHRRAASLSSHQSQAHYFLQPHWPRTLRKLLSALFGFVFAFLEAGRKRVPIVTARRFFRKFPIEGLVLVQNPPAARPHFFVQHFGDDRRVRIAG